MCIDETAKRESQEEMQANIKLGETQTFKAQKEQKDPETENEQSEKQKGIDDKVVN